MVTTSARAVMGVLSAAMIALGMGTCTGSSEGGAVSPPSVSQPTVAPPSPVPTSTLSPSAGSQPPVSASAGLSVPFSGSVQQIYSTGDFLLVSGPLTYTVVMLPTTTVVNLRGQRVPQQYIAVSGTVEVTGVLEDGKITAQNVLVPTLKDDV